MPFLDRAATALAGDASRTRHGAPVERDCRPLAAFAPGLAISQGY